MTEEPLALAVTASDRFGGTGEVPLRLAVTTAPVAVELEEGEDAFRLTLPYVTVRLGPSLGIPACIGLVLTAPVAGDLSAWMIADIPAPAIDCGLTGNQAIPWLEGPPITLNVPATSFELSEGNSLCLAMQFQFAGSGFNLLNMAAADCPMPSGGSLPGEPPPADQGEE